MSVHKKIKQARNIKGWTQEDVAEKLNITANAYGAIERGESHPTIPKLQKLCEVFEIELSELLENEETQIIHIAYKKSYKNNTGTHHHYNIGRCLPEYLELQTELEKQLLINELKDKELAMQQRENENLKVQITQLQKINELLEKN